ncbi:protein ALP1-like [Aplysia californica]|uniref:Protein ALP1-like n=1 Tax=Aplysia californica TaxID=6500 RepID=A0ABM0K4P3_APLCA|nr:protein ALP1-like [Aplysia californica]
MDSSSDEDIGIALALYVLSSEKRKRRFRAHPINQERERRGVMAKLYPQLCDDEDKFYNYARMSRASFEELLIAVQDDIRKQDTNFQQAISPRERLLLTLRFLATGESARSLHYQFRMGDSTVRKVVYDTCERLWEKLLDKEMPHPTETTLKEEANAFENMWQFPHCLGAVDGKHINIEIPPNSGSAFLNYNKKDFSIVLQGVADAKANFLAVDVGESGNHSDGGIFKHSSFGRALLQQQLPLPQPDAVMGEVLPYVFVADEAYPLHPNIMRPFPARGLDDRRRYFNYRLSRARRVVECAFGIMAQRWGVLKTTMRVNPDKARKIILACCILHNFVRRQQDESVDSAAEEASTDENPFQQQRSITERSMSSTGRPPQEAMEVREKFANLFVTGLAVP